MNYLDSGKCGLQDCAYRHPKVCKFWSKSRAGCKRDAACDFLHVSLAHQDANSNIGERLADQEYTCVGCKSSWNDSRFVVNHKISNQSVNFCLNCNDWVKDKERVLDINWTMFDERGDLRYDV